MHTNARRLTVDDSIDALLRELANAHWGAGVIDETRGAVGGEMWIPKDGNQVFSAAGRSTSSRGVALLIHNCHAHYTARFTPMNERIACID
eukprot:3455888-Pyramimonas_sp.AAC.1